MNRRWPTGLIDTHVHTAPDVVPRIIDDLELARSADAAGYRAVVLKSHHTVTAARAAVAEQVTNDTRVLGGVALNLHSTGGLNVQAVDAALSLGARTVWLPTLTSSNHIRHARNVTSSSANRRLFKETAGDGIDVLDEWGNPAPGLCAVLDLLAASSVTLATGHISPREAMVIVPLARRAGVPNVIVTHPELSCVAMSLEDQAELAALGGVWFERVYAVTLPTGDHLPVAALARAIRAIGVSSTILATDLGQVHNPPPVTGFQAYIASMREAGFSHDDIELMACANPARALRLDLDEP